MLDSSPKENVKEIPAAWAVPRTNFGVCRPKKGVTPGRRILKKEADTNMTKNKMISTRNLAGLLLHMLSNACRYQCVSKKAAEKPPPK